MYFKIHCPLELIQVACLLAPEAPGEGFESASEGREERLYFSVPNVPCRLLILREAIDPGAVIILGRDRVAGGEVEVLPDWLAQYVADELLTTVHVYTERFQRDRPELEPAELVRPHLLA